MGTQKEGIAKGPTIVWRSRKILDKEKQSRDSENGDTGVSNKFVKVCGQFIFPLLNNFERSHGPHLDLWVFIFTICDFLPLSLTILK